MKGTYKLTTEKNMTNTKTRWILFAAIAVLAFGIYSNILDNDPTNWDDPALFNRTTIHSLSLDNLGQILSFHKGSTYQPVRDLSYLIDFTLWKENVVLCMHLHSITLYYLMVLFCWLFLLELFKAFSVGETLSFTWATISTLVFAVHPIHVESVAWLYARKEPLLGIFTFLSLWTFIRARAGSMLCYALSGIMVVLAILSKPTALVIPAMMVVLDFALQAHHKDPGFWKKRLILYIPLFILVIPMIIRLVSMMSEVGGIKPYHGGSFWTNLLAVSQIFIEYIKLIGFTINYAADYPIKLYTDPHQWQAWTFLGINVLIAGSVLLAFIKKRFLFTVFVIWFYIFLLPVSHILPISQVMADRYALISSLSWCVLLGYGLARLWELRLQHPKLSPEFPKLLATALAAVVIFSYAYMTRWQNDVWQNSQTLWEDTLAKYPDSSPANVNLSVLYIKQGRAQEAQELCITAIKQVPYDYMAISNLALSQMLMGQFDNAIHNYQQALKLKPDLYKAKLGLANAYWQKKDYAHVYQMNAELLKSSQFDLKTYGGILFYRSGYAAWKLQKLPEAHMCLRKAEELNINDPDLDTLLVRTYTSMGISTQNIGNLHCAPKLAEQ